MQAAASSLNVALIAIRDYIAAMEDRLTQIRNVSKDYILTVRKDMPAAVRTVLDAAYDEGKSKGTADIARNKYAKPAEPRLQKAAKPGGATQLAAYMAHALALGYYDSGNSGPISGGFGTRPAMGGMPPLPFKR